MGVFSSGGIEGTEVTHYISVNFGLAIQGAEKCYLIGRRAIMRGRQTGANAPYAAWRANITKTEASRHAEDAQPRFRMKCARSVMIPEPEQADDTVVTQFEIVGRGRRGR